MNQILKQCDGKITPLGLCDKCCQPAHTTSSQCNRLLPVEQLQQPVVMQTLPLAFVKWYSGIEEEKILKAYERWKRESGIVPVASSAVGQNGSGGKKVEWCDTCGANTVWIDGVCTNFSG